MMTFLKSSLWSIGVGALSSFLLHVSISTCRGQNDAAPATAAPTWAFDSGPDDFKGDALLDLRSLNEKEAGDSGFVKADANGNFVLGNGQPARFWAINTDYRKDVDTQARFMAKRGVNLVRIFIHIAPDLKGPLTDFNKEDRDWCWRLEAALKKEGIYSLITPYFANASKLGASWGIVPSSNINPSTGLLFFDPQLQDAYKGWMKALLTEKNPYTGLTLAEDPAVAIIQIQNEDSLLFWTYNFIQGQQKTNLEKLFGTWLTQKYGSTDQAISQWQNTSDPDDNSSNGVVGLVKNIFDLTQPQTGGLGDRRADEAEFLAETMYNFNKSMTDYLRTDLGCKQLINAGNWKTADDLHLNDLERWSYTPTDVTAVNHYFSGYHKGPQDGWAILNGDTFDSPSVLLDPRFFPLNLKQIKGSPMIITESSWVLPMDYTSEGPFLVSAYQSLSGIGAFFWFHTVQTPEWTPPESANGFLPSQEKWVFANPDMLGTFPGAALMYRMGYLKRGDPVVHEERAMADLWQRKEPVITEMSGFDPNRDSAKASGASNTGLPLRTYLVGPVEVVYGGDPSKTQKIDFSTYLDDSAKTIRSVTGEITMNNDKGYCMVNAPKAQGVTAFFKNQRDFDLQDVHIHSDNDYASVLVVSMDNKALKESGKILVQIGTQSRPTDWQEQPATISQKNLPDIQGFEVVNYGKAPWQIVQAQCEVTVNNPGVTKGTALDMNGNGAGDVPLEKIASGIRFKFPDKTMYVILN